MSSQRFRPELEQHTIRTVQQANNTRVYKSVKKKLLIIIHKSESRKILSDYSFCPRQIYPSSKKS